MTPVVPLPEEALARWMEAAEGGSVSWVEASNLLPGEFINVTLGEKGARFVVPGREVRSLNETMIYEAPYPHPPGPVLVGEAIYSPQDWLYLFFDGEYAHLPKDGPWPEYADSPWIDGKHPETGLGAYVLPAANMPAEAARTRGVLSASVEDAATAVAFEIGGHLADGVAECEKRGVDPDRYVWLITLSEKETL